MKRVLSFALGVFAAFAGVACRGRNDTGAATAPGGPPPAAAPRPLRIAMIAKSASNPSFVAARTGAENRARELSASSNRPIQIEWLTPPQEDGAVQAQRIAQAVKEGMDAVLLSCSDARAVTPAIDDAVAHGVPVMTFDSDAPESKRFAYCGVDDVRAGEMIMEELARLVPRGAHVAVLAGNRAAPNLSRRVEGVLREAARRPDLKVIGTFYTVETPEEASATVIHIDAAHPDIEGWAMVGGWALYTKTLLNDLQQDDRRRKRPVKIVSINALPPQLAYVEAGVAPVLLAQPMYRWGETSVDAIVDRVTGKKQVPARIPAELVRVSADNLGGWARQLHAWGFADVPEELLRAK
ncbi:MAG TPA: substrate-binding domain-containing protein [Polyangia bacterium]|nr:substrate-binding domain-containing protein [Polyangia bacterium]